MSKNEIYERKFAGATIRMRRVDGHVVLRVAAGLFRKEWNVPLEDARWVRDSLFEMLS